MKVKLSEICSINMGQSPDSSTYNQEGNGLPFFQGNADFGVLYPTVRVWCNNPTKIAQKGDVLFSVRAPIGAMNIADRTCCIGRGLSALRVDEAVCDVRYFWYALSSKTEELIAQGTGSTFKAISKKVLENAKIPLPSMEKQQQIAPVLDKLSTLISLRKQQLAKLDELVKVRFVEMFAHVSREDTLRNLCTIIDYRGKTPEKAEIGLPFITAKNIRMHRLSLEPKEYISKKTYDAVMTRGFPKEGDVVFTTEAPLGNVCRLPHFDTEFYVGQRIVTMQTKVLVPAYLEYALDTDEFRRKVEKKSSGSTVTGIRVRLLEQLTIPVPDRDEQERFAAFVDRIDQTKSFIQRSLDKTQTLKSSLMQQYFG